ncbi:MAG: hypothetical protein HYS25_04235 [Ignavibacteriales bacterium]|nr:hypothetical protein [Ignavibacteriales bacterium]
MKHIDENILEKFAIDKNLLNDEEVLAVKSHLKECGHCRELYSFYLESVNELEESSLTEPSDIDYNFAQKLKSKLEPEESKLLRDKNGAVQIFNGNAEIITKKNIYSLQNIYRLIKTYPVSSFSFAAVCVMAASFLVTTFKDFVKDTNPASLEIKHSVLYAYNQAGQLLWNKNVDGIYADKIDSVMIFTEGRKKCVNLLDIDNDNKNEILITGSLIEKGLYRTDSLYCFNSDGTKRWTVSPEDQKFNYAPKWKRTNWWVEEFFTAKSNNGVLLYVLANVETYGGTVLSTLNPLTGKVTSSLYHSGHYTTQFHYDMDGDGNDEIFLGGISSYDRPFVMILKQPYLMGVMPDYFSSNHKVPGNAWYYVLLPVSKLSKIAGLVSPASLSVIKKFDKDGIVCYSDDVPSDKRENRLRLLYSFNKKIEIQFINYTTQYKALYDEIVSKGKIKEGIVSYLATLKDSVKYWDGDKFVNYPTVNKYWNQKFRLPGK